MEVSFVLVMFSSLLFLFHERALHLKNLIAFSSLHQNYIVILSSFCYIRTRRKKLEDVANSNIVQNIPELLNIMDILLGEDRPTLEACGNDWERMVLSNVLYKSSPSFSMQSITYLMELTSSPSSSSSLEFKNLTMFLLQGQVGPLFKYLYECFFMNEASLTRGLGLFPSFSSSSSSSGPHMIERSIEKLSLVPQLAVSQLAYMLGAIGVLELDVSGGLQGYGLNQDVGIELSVGKTLTEELMLTAIEALSTMNYPIEILACYLRTCPYNGGEYARVLLPKRQIHSDKDMMQLSSMLRSLGFEHEACALEISRGVYWLKTRNNIVKALYFFIKANDTSRVECLCEKVTWKCIMSLLCDGDTSGFLLPSFPQPPQRFTEFDIDKSMDNNEVTSDDGMPDKLQHNFELARDVLSLIGADAYMPNISLPSKNTYSSPTAWFLFYYVRIVSNGKSKSTEDPYSVQLVVENFMEAAKCISIVLDDSEDYQNAAPLRFWTHLIDVAAWLEDRYSELLQFIPEYNDESLTQAFSDGQFPTNLFTKRQAYSLMVSLDKVNTSLSAERLMCDALDEAVINLRKKLMSIWCSAVIDENRRSNNLEDKDRRRSERVYDGIDDNRSTRLGDNDKYSDSGNTSEAVLMITTC